jgi:hypothetical protein
MIPTPYLAADAPFPVQYPGLARLTLSREELEALHHQGFVQREPRGPNFACFKLRFRVAGRQRVVYLGSDPETAGRISRELKALQHEVRRSRQASRALKIVRRTARDVRRRSAEVLAGLGLKFHGTTLRKSRGAFAKQIL